jgi:hypothetical protein
MSSMTKNDLFKGPQYSCHTRDLKSDMRKIYKYKDILRVHWNRDVIQAKFMKGEVRGCCMSMTRLSCQSTTSHSLS